MSKLERLCECARVGRAPQEGAAGGGVRARRSGPARRGARVPAGSAGDPRVREPGREESGGHAAEAARAAAALVGDAGRAAARVHAGGAGLAQGDPGHEHRGELDHRAGHQVRVRLRPRQAAHRRLLDRLRVAAPLVDLARRDAPAQGPRRPRLRRTLLLLPAAQPHRHPARLPRPRDDRMPSPLLYFRFFLLTKNFYLILKVLM